MDKNAQKKVLKDRRKKRIRSKVFGTAERPRVSVFRSSTNVYVQVIDDVMGNTLVAVHSFDNEKRANKEICKQVGASLAAKCKEKNISKVVFDKNGYAYHGRVAAIADGAREAGLQL
jgi:large subunit ribosomal protein L18